MEEDDLLLSIRGDKSIYYSVAYQYMMATKRNQHKKDWIVLKNNNSIAIFSNRGALMFKM